MIKLRQNSHGARESISKQELPQAPKELAFVISVMAASAQTEAPQDNKGQPGLLAKIRTRVELQELVMPKDTARCAAGFLVARFFSFCKALQTPTPAVGLSEQKAVTLR